MPRIFGVVVAEFYDSAEETMTLLVKTPSGDKAAKTLSKEEYTHLVLDELTVCLIGKVLMEALILVKR